MILSEIFNKASKIQTMFRRVESTTRRMNESLTTDQNSTRATLRRWRIARSEESSVWRCLKLDERAVDTRDSDSARRWRCGDVLRKKRGKRKNGGGEKSERDGRGGGKTGGMGMRGGS